ncbi:MAG: hypothetical protein ACT4P5_18335 [Armatimonadota bacterium]
MAEFQVLAQERPGGLNRLLIFPLLLAITLAAVASLTGTIEVDAAAVVLLAVFSLLAVFIFARAARSEPDGALLFQVLVLAWLVKLGSVAFKLYIAYGVYGGGVDSIGYHIAGTEIAATLAAGQLPDLSHFWGTQFVENLTGVLYLITTPTHVGAWIVFAFLGSMGMLFYYKAFVTACPSGSRRWYMALVLFAPSLVIWTNSLGKDALIAFFLGMTTFGVALIYRQGLQIGSMLATLIGLGGVMAVRPHVAGIAAVGLTAAVLLRPIRAGMLTPLIRLSTLAIVAALAFFVVRSAATFSGVEDVSVEGVSSFLEAEEEQSQQGGSAFEGSFPTNPAAFGLAVVTVLFRPFPWEASNVLAMATAIEGMVLIALVIYRFRGVLRAIGSVRRNAFLAFAVLYALMFIFFFSTISNFGILARQRAQLLPFIFILLAFLPSRGEHEHPGA